MILNAPSGNAGKKDETPGENVLAITDFFSSLYCNHRAVTPAKKMRPPVKNVLASNDFFLFMIL
jgi:hypothetical protein